MAVARRARTVEPVPALVTLFDEASGRLPGAKAKGVLDWRRASFERFRATGFPTTRVEEWKYTNIARVANQPLALASKVEVSLRDVEPYLAGGFKARRILFVNGHVAPELSHIEGLPSGVRVMSLGRALEADPEQVAGVVDAAADEARAFTSLNAAFTTSGAWIEVADGVEVTEPIQLIFLSIGRSAPSMTNPRNVVRLGKGSSLHLIETHVGLGEGYTLTNLVTQTELGEAARLEHDRLQIGRDGTTLIGKSFTRLAARSRLKQTLATLGGDLVRNESEMRLEGPEVECLMNGLYLARGSEHVDNLIRMHHVAPNCHSDQFYKGVVEEKAHAVFSGKVIVHPDAQKTNAYQKNDNLLLSDEAEIDTKPELEIYADDVKCSHGATCGDLDPLALFYLRSRGLPQDVAKSVLTFAFAAEVIGRFTDESLRHQARAAALARLPGGEGLGELA